MSTNGISTNSISTNGISTNGISTKGISTNGISTNGISTNGICTNGISNFVIRKAEIQDMKAVFQMIKELAEWEKMTHKLKIDKERLTKDFANNAFNSLVVESADGSLVGYSIYNIDYSTWEGKSLSLVDLFVKEIYRGHKIGEKLFIAVMKEGGLLGCQKAHFHVLSWNPAVTFYKKLGCTDGGQYLIYRLEQENFKKLIQNN